MNESVNLLQPVPPEPYNSIAPDENINTCGNSIVRTTTTNSEDNETENENDDIYFPLHPVSSTISHEFAYLIKHSIPVFFTFFIQYLIQILIPTYFSSQLGSIYMSACTLSITTFYLTGPVLINGFSSSLDTLCSTAFGARHYHKVGRYYVQCTIIMLILMIPSMLFWGNSLPFFNLITHISYPDDDELPQLCASFLSNFKFVAPAVVIFECTKRFLQSQCKFSVPTRVVVCGIPVSILLNFYLKNHHVLSNLNKHSAPAISFVLTYWLMTISLVSYVIFIDGYKCLPSKQELKSWTLKSILHNSPIFFKLGIPGILMILSEALAFQILTFASTTFPKSQLAAQSIIQTLASLAFQPPYSIGICCSTHIANIIGACSLNYKPAMSAIYLIMIILSIFNFTWFYVFRNSLAMLFTTDEEILAIVSKLAKIIAVNQFLDCFNIISAAVLRGQGRQKIGSILSLTAYYLIGLPVEWYFGFKLDYKIYGLWIGLALAVSTLSLVELLIVSRSQWMKIIKRNHKLA